MQLTIDEVIARGDVDLLIVLALGFGILMLVRVAASAMRSLVLLVLQNVIHFHLGARLFRHLIRLPTAFFEQRHIGDVLSRFTSLQPIRTLLAEGMITALIDGIMAILTLVMIFVYSPALALIVIGALLLYAIIRLALYRVLWRRTQATIQAGAQENSTFIETVRAIQCLKLFNRESEREGQWLNRYAEVANANVRLGRAKIAFSTINDLIFGVELILIVFLAARLVLAGQLTVGMVFAFMAYRQHFTDRSVALIEKALEFRILGLHLERLSDIALTPLEKGHDQPLSYARPLEGGLELRNVFFRYSETEPFVLENINLKIEAGEFVTITGPSGGGKTTLIKLMLGLLEPTSGEVLVDGLPLATMGARAFREQVAAVMQEDQLLSGSIADNISFFDQQFDEEKLLRCAKLAGMHSEIMAMPMTYNSLIGDMGSSLSGGQKQRVLLARALYRDPRILFLDEGTAHLDVETERVISTSLRQLHMTRDKCCPPTRHRQWRRSDHTRRAHRPVDHRAVGLDRKRIHSVTGAVERIASTNLRRLRSFGRSQLCQPLDLVCDCVVIISRALTQASALGPGGGRITLERRQHNPVHRADAVVRTASPFKLLNRPTRS